MQLTIRRMQPDDALSVNRLSVQLGYPLSLTETIQQIEKVVSTPDHIALVAVRDERIIGWIHAFKSLYIESLTFVEIGGLVVDENNRGKGVGKELINQIKDWCNAQQIYSIRLRTQVKRLDAHEFYRALGFQEIKEQKVFQLTLHQ